mgnify:FL=1
MPCHIFMDGVDYKKAAAAHENGPREDLIREHLAAYQKAGISYVRDGGDPYGAGVLARSLAPEYGITYRAPVFAIHRAGRYGKNCRTRIFRRERVLRACA